VDDRVAVPIPGQRNSYRADTLNSSNRFSVARSLILSPAAAASGIVTLAALLVVSLGLWVLRRISRALGGTPADGAAFATNVTVGDFSSAIVCAGWLVCTAPAVAAEEAQAGEPAAAAGADPVTPGDAAAQGVQILGATVTGSADATYQYLSTSGLFRGGVPSRSFDFQQDALTIHQAALALALQPKQGFGALVNVTVGRDAQVIKSYPIASDAQLDLTQAYVQYATGSLTLLGGKFATLAGAEVISEPQNTNFSRSILFGYAVPFTHTGLRAVDALDDAWTLTLGVVNGWDQITAPDGGKTVEFGLGWTPSKRVSVIVDGYAGPEPIAAAPRDVHGERELIDAVLTWNASEKLALVLNYDWGAQAADAVSSMHTARWSGLAGYVNMQWTSEWRTSVRAETFDDRDGYRTGVEQTWSELTLTLGFAPTKNLELRLEGRADKSSAADAFIRSDAGTAAAASAADPAGAPSAPGYAARQNSAALQALFKF
jgi:hypothetical protein